MLRLDGEPRSALCLSLLLAEVSIAGRLEHLLWVLFIHLIESHHGPCEGGFIIFNLKMAKPEPREAANWNCSYFISALSYSKFMGFFLFLLAPSLLCWASYINSPPPYSSAAFLYWPWTCWLQDPSASSANVPVNAASGRQASRFFTMHGVSART